MAGNGWKLLVIAGNCLKRLKMAENGWKWLEYAVMAGHGWKWLEIT